MAGQSLLLIGGIQSFTYTVSLNSNASVPNGIMLQAVTEMRDRNFFTNVSSDIPFNDLGSYIFFLLNSATVYDQRFPVRDDEGRTINNPLAVNNKTAYSSYYVYAPSSSLVTNPVNGVQFNPTKVGDNPVYLYQNANIGSLPIPSGEIAQVTAVLGSNYLIPASEVYNNKTAYLFYYRVNLTTNQIDLIIPTNRFQTNVSNGLASNPLFQIYTFQSGIKYRRISPPTPISSQQTTITNYNNYYWYKSYFEVVYKINEDLGYNSLYNVTITYTFEGNKYLLSSNNLSVHGSNFATFTHFVNYNDAYFLNLRFPTSNKYGSGNYNLLISDQGKINGDVQVLFYK
jgi:hypothetical protein